MISNAEFNMIAELDLNPIKVKLMHKESGEGWTRSQVDAVEFEYRRFLYLIKLFPDEQVAPRFDVDIFWHYHILDTMKYAADCAQIFGYFVHHFPYSGLGGDGGEAAHRRTGARMQALYEAVFGEPFIRPAEGQVVMAKAQLTAPETAWCNPAAPTSAWCNPAAPKTAWCNPASAKTAWCNRTTKNLAWLQGATAILARPRVVAQNDSASSHQVLAIAA